MSGQQSTIDWQVLNADTVTITPGIGNVSASGSRAVSPTTTTQYRLTARNRKGEVSATTTVVVEAAPAAQFTACSVSPMNIMTGESATITYATTNADTVEISGIGNVATSGTRVVSPTSTTTYNLTARNAQGSANCSVTVQVSATGTAPRVLNFSASPTSINSGNTSTLSWGVENATTVSISGIGNVDPTGTRAVSPTATTTYTLTATNSTGNVTATTTVTVAGGPGPGPGAPTITGCAAAPSTSPAPGSPVVISYVTANATAVAFTPAVAGAGLNGPVTVMPAASTTYTITATGSENRTAVCTVAVTVTPTPPGPVPNVESLVETFNRETVLDASQSTDPSGGALTFVWTPLGTGAAILDQGQARTRVQLAGLAGDYPFRLTVRNAAGQESTATVTVRFRSSTIP